MGRIKNKIKYALDTNVTFDDYVIGSDFEDNGKTKNFSMQGIFDLIAGELGVIGQDAKAKFINFGSASSPLDGVPVVSDFINALPDNGTDYKTVLSDERVFFEGYVSVGRGLSSFNTYVVVGKNKGIYGVGGDLVVAELDLKLIESVTTGGVVFPPITDDPNADVKNLGEIPSGDFLAAINALPTFTIVAGTNCYFEFTVAGSRFVYGFDGTNGTYGSGGLTVVDDDVFLIYDESSTPTGEWVFEKGSVLGSIKAIDSLNVNSGVYSLSGGQNSNNSGQHAFVWGTSLVNSGADTAIFGSQNSGEGDHMIIGGAGNTGLGWAGAVFGIGNTSHSLTEVVLGQYGTDYTINAGTTFSFDILDRVFNIGIGTGDLDRKDAFQVLKGGEVLAPELTTAKVDGADDKVLITKEYLNRRVVTEKITLTPTQIVDSETTPEVLISSKGVGTVISVVKIVGRVRVNTTPFTFGGFFGGGFNFRLSGSSSNPFTMKTGFIESVSDAIGTAELSSFGSFQENVIEDSDFIVELNSTPTLIGDSEVDFYITYEVVDL